MHFPQSIGMVNDRGRGVFDYSICRETHRGE